MKPTSGIRKAAASASISAVKILLEIVGLSFGTTFLELRFWLKTEVVQR